MDRPANPFSLHGKRILVTGASSGIGQQIAMACASMGAQLLITGRHGQRLADTLAMLPGEGHQSLAADLTHAVDLAALTAQAEPLHGLAHAAGISRLVPLRMLKPAHLHEMFAHNTYAPILLIQQLTAARKLLPQASIVLITALASHAGPIASTAYAASKAALLGASRSMAQDLARQGIRVNCIAPGYVQTVMLEQLSQGGANLQERVHEAPLGIGQPQDIAYATVFHLSDACRSINCSYFMVDGGISIPMQL